MADDLRRIIISGKVQGVNYRNWTVDKARDAGLRGWVRNLSDGTVEALFAGEMAAIAAMIELCRTGPQGRLKAEVKAVNERPATFDMMKLVKPGETFSKIGDARRPAQ